MSEANACALGGALRSLTESRRCKTGFSDKAVNYLKAKISVSDLSTAYSEEEVHSRLVAMTKCVARCE